MKIINWIFKGLGPVLFLLLFIMTGCLDDNYDFSKISDEIEIYPEFSAPIGSGSMTLTDILENLNDSGFIKEDDDKLLYLTFENNLTSVKASDIIDIPDQNFVELYLDSEFTFPFGFPAGLKVELSKNQDGVFVFNNNERIDSVILKNSILRIKVNSSYKHFISLIIQSPGVIINNQPFSRTISISDVSGNYNETIDINLDGSKIILDNDSNPDTSYLPLSFKLELVSSGAGISSGDKLDIEMSFINIDFYAVHGYIGNYNALSNDGAFSLDFFSGATGGIGDIFFYDPQIELQVDNSYGVPMSIEIADFIAKTGSGDLPVEFSYDTVSTKNKIYINSPSSPGENAVTKIPIYRTNSNFASVLESKPTEIQYKTIAKTNPSGPGAINNFVLDTSEINVDFSVVLPIWFKASGFSMKDTIDFDMEEQLSGMNDIIESLKVRLDISNGLPMEVDLQVLFADEYYTVLDSMFTGARKFLEGPDLDDNDKVSAPAETQNIIELTDARLEAIKEAKYAILRASVSTSKADENRYVKFFTDYKLDYSLKIAAKLKVNSRDL